jgi:N-acyl-L-homoserine lactone synthetase
MRSAAEVTPITPGRSADLLDRIDYRLAETSEQKEEMYRLRYRAYLREGAIMPSADERVTDRFDESPWSWIFGVYIDGELCSSIRVSVATPSYPTSPSVEVFPDVLRPELARGRTLVDPTRFVADPERAKHYPELPYATVRLGYVAGVHFNADIGLATVRAEHRAFYRRVFLQEPLCEPRLFPGLLKPVGLMAAHYPTLRDKVFARYPYLHSSVFERRMLFERGNEARGVPEQPRQCASVGVGA